MGEAKRKRLLQQQQGQKQIAPFLVPDDIKRDIAKAVRSIEWQMVGGAGGTCFFQALAGYVMLEALGIPAELTLGGMVYRAGPDPYRDVFAFCGPGNVGCRGPNNMLLGHYFIKSGDDLVDFSVGDWQWEANHLPEAVTKLGPKLGPIQWTAPPLPEFFWADYQQFSEPPGAQHPELGRAWYTAFQPREEGIRFSRDTQRDPYVRKLRETTIRPHAHQCFEHYALKERIWAAREGHTAVRLSALAQLTGVSESVTRAWPHDQLVVLRGKQPITRETALKIIAEHHSQWLARN